MDILALSLSTAACDRPAVPPPATSSHTVGQASRGQRVDHQPGETGPLTEPPRKPSAGGRRVAVLGAGDSTGTKHNRAILAAEFDLFLNAQEFTRARQIAPPPGSCSFRCDSLEDCEPTSRPRLRSASTVCEGGFCFDHPCASGAYAYVENAVCIAEGGEWRATLICDSEADCQDIESIRSGEIQFGDACLDGRCQQRTVCSPDWCRGDLPQSPHKYASCENDKCVFSCKTEQDCVGWPNLPVDRQIPSRWYTCSRGKCKWACTAETCNPEVEPAFRHYPKGMACTPEGGRH